MYSSGTQKYIYIIAVYMGAVIREIIGEVTTTYYYQRKCKFESQNVRSKSRRITFLWEGPSIDYEAKQQLKNPRFYQGRFCCLLRLIFDGFHRKYYNV